MAADSISLRILCGTLRRLLLVSAAFGLLVATSASAALTPIRRPMGEASLPRVRAGVITIPAAHRQGVTRVIVRLSQPPLAAWRSNGSLAFAARSQRLDTHSASSRAYLSQLARRQAVVAAQVRAAIPQARIQEHFAILLDGFTVQLPARALPRLLRLSSVDKVYPSLTYTRTMDRGPSVIHATELQAARATRARASRSASSTRASTPRARSSTRAASPPGRASRAATRRRRPTR